MKQKIITTTILTLLLLVLTSATTKAKEYEYDDLNRLVEVRYDNGDIINYTYDLSGNIENVTVTKSQTITIKNPKQIRLC